MSQTGLKHAGGIYNEARLTTGLTTYGFLGAAEKTLFFFLPTKPRPESAQKAVWPQFLPQTNTEHAEIVDEKSPKSKCLGAETVWKHAKRTRGQTHVSWGGRGRWFKSSHSDQHFVWNEQKSSQIVRFRLDFCLLCYCLFASTIPKMVWCIVSA